MISNKDKRIYEHRVEAASTPQSWTRFRRKSRHVIGEVLRFLETFVQGNYAIGPKYIIFENETDALFYKLKYPR